MNYRTSLIIFIYLLFLSSMVYSHELVDDRDNEHNEDSKKLELKIDLP